MGFAVGTHHALDVHGLVHSGFLLLFGFRFHFCCIVAFHAALLLRLRTEPVQAQGVGNHANAGEGHGCRPQHGVQGQSQAAEHTGGNGDADDVVDERPEQVFLDVAHHPTGQAHRLHHILEGGLHEYHIRRIQGDVRPGANGDAHLGTGQRRGIVDAVPHHGHGAGLGQALYFRRLIRRQHTGAHLVDAHLLGHRLSGARVVAGDQSGLDAQRMESSDGVGAVRFDLVGYGDDAQGFAVQGKIQGGLALTGQAFPLLCQGTDRDVLFFHQLQIAAHGGLAVQLAAEAMARQGGESGQLRCCHALFLAPGHYGAGQGMFALGFQCQGGLQQGFLGNPLCWNQVGHMGFPLRDGAGLVQDDDVGLAHGFQRSGGLEQNPRLGAGTAAHHDGDWGSQTQGAGTADNQDADGTSQGKADGLPHRQPDDAGDKRQKEHGGHKDGGHFVGDLGDGCLAGGRLLYQADHLADGGISADPRGLTGQEAALVGGGGGDGATRPLVHRQTFAGEHGFIYGALALDYLAIHWDALPGTHQELVAYHHVLHWNLHLPSLPQDGGLLGGQIHEAADGVGGLALAVGFQGLAHGDKGQDHGGALKVVFIHIGHGRFRPALCHGRACQKEDNGAV